MSAAFKYEDLLQIGPVVAEPPRKDQAAAILKQQEDAKILVDRVKGLVPHGPRTKEEVVASVRKLLELAIEMNKDAGAGLVAGAWTKAGNEETAGCNCPMMALIKYVSPVPIRFRWGYDVFYTDLASEYLGVPGAWVRSFTNGFDGETQLESNVPEAYQLGKELREKYQPVEA